MPKKTFIGRLLIYLSLAVTATVLAVFGLNRQPVGAAQICQQSLVEAAAKQDIEYLRRQYAKATDLIGIGTPESEAEGREIYHRIFAADVNFETSGDGEMEIAARGPEQWVEIVSSYLKPLGPTQHLIGSQLVDLKNIELADDCSITGGTAHMQSYVQAWHDMPDNTIWMFMGTYVDDVVFTPETGWVIQNMNLVQVTDETRTRAGK